MSTSPAPATAPPSAGSMPRYELRVRSRGSADLEMAVWQVPAPATPHIKVPTRIAGLRGRNFALVEHRILRWLAQARIQLGANPGGARQTFPLDEDLALTLGLLFRVLAPMRNREFMRACAAGIEGMGREEAAYWLGMAMHRQYPRRVLMALRFLLIDPKG